MLPRICYSPSITRRTCLPCSLDQFKTLLSDPEVQSICDRIKLLDGRDPEEMARLKRQLPVITPHAQSFQDNRRRADTAVPSGLVMLDIDHIDDPRAIWEDIREMFTLAKPGTITYKIVFVAVTPSGHGLRFIAERRLQDLAADQQALATYLGFSTYDSCTKDLSRASFVMPLSYVLYMDDAAFSFPDQAAADHAASLSGLLPVSSSSSGFSLSPSPLGESEGVRPSASSLSPSPAVPHGAFSPSFGEISSERDSGGAATAAGDTREDESFSAANASYRGLPYSGIISELVSLLGGEPSFGERNTFYFTLVRYARYICDFSQPLLLSVLPDFGLSEAERRSVISSAVNRPRKSDTPDLVRRAVALAQAAADLEKESSVSSKPSPLGESEGVSLPPLPHPLDIICSHLPESFRPAMVIAALPILGALATRVRFKYLDHATHSFSFMSCITAPAATGKSFIRTPVKLLLTPIDEQDAIERQKEEEYKDALRAAKNSKNQPENPRACPRNNGINISVAKLLQLLTYSECKHLIGIGEEIDTLVKTERAGVWSQKSDIYRLGFDNARYGQCYMNDNSFSANVEVYYNLLLTGTPGGMYRFFKDVEDGLVTRFCFATLPDMFACEMPDFVSYTEAEQQEVIRCARYLDRAEGTITCPAVDAAISRWLEEKRQLAIKSDSRAVDTLRRRAAVIGFRAGYLASLLEGCSSSSASPSVAARSNALAATPDASEPSVSSAAHSVPLPLASEALWDGEASCECFEETGCPQGGEGASLSASFASWVAEYVMQNQLQLFGQQFEKVADDYQASVSTRGQVRRLLQSLPDTFTKSDLMALRARNGQSTDVSYVLARWKNNRLITETSPGTFRKC